MTAISQVLWGSIGYSVGALQGAALAVKEQGLDRRVILFVGDGSLQLTCQEISTMIRHNLTPIMYVFAFSLRYSNQPEFTITDLQTFLPASYLTTTGIPSNAKSTEKMPDTTMSIHGNTPNSLTSSTWTQRIQRHIRLGPSRIWISC